MRYVDFCLRRNRPGCTAVTEPQVVDVEESRRGTITELSRRGGAVFTHGGNSATTEGPLVATDREVLRHFFRATGGESWKYRHGWAENAADLSSWYGVATNEDGRVVGLELRGAYSGLRFTGNNLVGVIPPEIGQLKALTNLDLTGNKLSGAVPSELGQLDALEHLMLPHNELSGAIPSKLGGLTALKRLSLAGNNISGPIPPELGKLASVEQLNLYFNDLRGNIPPELGGLSSLRKLFLSENRLNGSIPPELGRLGALKRLYLSMNELTGTIPSELGRLSALEGLDLSWNNLNGAIPPRLQEMGALRTLSLTGNKLSGNIPSELKQLSSLKRLHLGENKLSGAIPAELGELVTLRTLVLSGNELEGAVPKELGYIPDLGILRADDNKLTSLGEAKDALWFLRRLRLTYRPAIKNNPWIMPPEAIVERGGGVFKYLLDVEKAEEAGARVELLQLLKVVLVGSSKAGKTSLVKSMISGRGSRTVGNPVEVSTVGIELLRHRLRNTTIEFYDCAGQVDYAGMHQTFLSKRALYLLVWDVGRCLGKDGDDLDEVIIEDIMQWLFALHLRAPGSTILLVANKCDLGSTDVSAVANKVKRRAVDLLQEWKGKRGVQSDAHSRMRKRLAWSDRAAAAAAASAAMGAGATTIAATRRRRRRIADVTLLPEPSLVSCLDGSGLATLIDRVAEQGATSISVPPAWGLALKVIDALRGGQDPLQAARQHLRLLLSPPRSNPGELTDGDRHRDSVLPQPRSPFVTRAALTELWGGIVKVVEKELKSPAEKMAVCNPETALEGALWISEYAGQTVSVANGDGTFVDAVWISTALKPILSHKLEREVFPSDLANMRDELVHDGILRRELAAQLWSREMGEALMAYGVVGALCQVLIDLGVALPLDPTSLLTAGGGTFSPTSLGNSGGLDLLVIMRLPETCSSRQQSKLDALLASLRSAEYRRKGGRRNDESGGYVPQNEVTLKWRFDWAGPPRGLVERLIASCHAIGKVEQGLCWRYGAVFKSHAMISAGGIESAGRLYTFLIRYDKAIADESRILSMRLFGPLKDARVWAALRWVASAMISISRDWPGVLWEGWPECVEGHVERAYFVTPDKAHVGDWLLPDADPTATPRACDCRNIDGGVLRLVLEHLGKVVDTQRGDPFANLPDAEVAGEEEQLPLETASQYDKGAYSCFCCNTNDEETYRIWLLSHCDAGKAAGGFWTAALTFLGAAVSLKETDKTGWRVCLAIMGIFLLGAAVATVYACRQHIDEVRTARSEEAVIRQRGGDPPGVSNAQDLAAGFA